MIGPNEEVAASNGKRRGEMRMYKTVKIREDWKEVIEIERRIVGQSHLCETR